MSTGETVTATITPHPQTPPAGGADTATITGGDRTHTVAGHMGGHAQSRPLAELMYAMAHASRA